MLPLHLFNTACVAQGNQLQASKEGLQAGVHNCKQWLLRVL
jgi:hypothetical protein